MELSQDDEKNHDPSGEEQELVWEGVDLTDLTKRLLGFADALLRRRAWRCNFAGTPPGGLSAQDLVQTAFQKYPSRHKPHGVEPFAILAGIVRTEVAHLAARPENRELHLFLSEGDGPGLVDPTAISDSAQATAEDRMIAEDWLRRLRTRFQGDERLLEFASLLASDQYETAQELAEILDVPRNTIFNMKRRLVRFFRGEREED